MPKAKNKDGVQDCVQDGAGKGAEHGILGTPVRSDQLASGRTEQCKGNSDSSDASILSGVDQNLSSGTEKHHQWFQEYQNSNA